MSDVLRSGRTQLGKILLLVATLTACSESAKPIPESLITLEEFRTIRDVGVRYGEQVAFLKNPGAANLRQRRRYHVQLSTSLLRNLPGDSWTDAEVLTASGKLADEAELAEKGEPELEVVLRLIEKGIELDAKRAGLVDKQIKKLVDMFNKGWVQATIASIQYKN